MYVCLSHRLVVWVIARGVILGCEPLAIDSPLESPFAISSSLFSEERCFLSYLIMHGYRSIELSLWNFLHDRYVPPICRAESRRVPVPPCWFRNAHAARSLR
jgi:hypothetical protein